MLLSTLKRLKGLTGINDFPLISYDFLNHLIFLILPKFLILKELKVLVSSFVEPKDQNIE